MMQWAANVVEEILNFSNVLNASISASWLILAVCLLRFLLKKAPKWTHVALWGVVAVRLLLPFSIESAFSLIPSAETVPQEILRYEGTKLQESAYLDIISNPVFYRDATIQIGQTVDHIQMQMNNMTFIWLIGIVVLLLYTAFSYGSLRRKVSEAVILRDNIFQSGNVTSPFVLGIVKPRIYLPYKLNSQDLEHVIAHEQAHIRRKDHWWKPLGFLLLTIHWFNPLMWLAYVLLCRDIELACDEKVIKELDNEQRADYTQALVTCSVNRRRIAACPLAFGEIGVKERVKSVMNYKKPAFWSVILALFVCVVAAVCFLTNPLTSAGNPWVQEYIPGTGNILGNVDKEKFESTSGDFAIGADKSTTEPAPQEAQRLDDTEDLQAQNDSETLAYLNSTGDLDIRIRKLLDEICASPGTASSPASYIEAHDEEYQELLSYGEYTLRYCFSEFLSGDQTDLRGHIMAAVCGEISNIWGEALLIDEPAPATGQDWFDAFNRNAKSLADQFGAEEMEKDYPASWLLLQMIDE